VKPPPPLEVGTEVGTIVLFPKEIVELVKPPDGFEVGGPVFPYVG